MSYLLYTIPYLAQCILQTAEPEDSTIMTDFSFLSPSSIIQSPQNASLQLSPPKHASDPPPLIILDDYSIVHALQDPSADNNSEPSAIPEIPLNRTLFHHSNYPTSADSDSEMYYPPSSGVPSEASSAAASEPDIPSAVASEADLPPQSHLRPPAPKKQAGIQDFFRALTEDEVEVMQKKRKRKRTESEEEADRAARQRKEEQRKEKKASARLEANHLAQQKRRKKLTTIEIQTGVRDSDGNQIPVSYFSSLYLV